MSQLFQFPACDVKLRWIAGVSEHPFELGARVVAVARVGEAQAGGKACLAVPPLRTPGTADEEPDEEGPVLEPAVADDPGEPEDDDPDEEGYTL